MIPVNGATVSISLTTLIINFDEAIAEGSGTVDLIDLFGPTTYPIPLTDVTVSSNQATIDITNVGATPLTDLQTYEVNIVAGVFVDASPATNGNTPIVGSSDWDFTAGVGPTALTFVPTFGSTINTAGATISVTFDGAVEEQAGQDIIINEDDGTAFLTITLSDIRVTGTGTSTITIDLMGETFTDGTTYEVDIASGVFEDSPRKYVPQCHYYRRIRMEIYY